jgi:hypothetical protein
MKFSCFFLFLIFAKSLYEAAGDVTLADSLASGEQENMVDVRLKFEGKELILSFPRTKEAALPMASKFCHDRLGEDDSRMKDCIRSVGEYLVSEVEKEEKRFMDNVTETAGRNVSVTLEVSGRRYNISINPVVETSEAAAAAFCLENHESLGVSIVDIDRYCIPPIKERIDEVMVNNKPGNEKSGRLKESNDKQPEKKKRKPKSSDSTKKVVLLYCIPFFLFVL